MCVCVCVAKAFVVFRVWTLMFYRVPHVDIVFFKLLVFLVQLQQITNT